MDFIARQSREAPAKKKKESNFSVIANTNVTDIVQHGITVSDIQ